VKDLQGAKKHRDSEKEMTMRHLLTLAALAILSCGCVLVSWAEDKAPAPSPDAKKVEATTNTTVNVTANAKANAELRIAIHRATADLIEARIAEKPDQAKIDELTKKLQELRGKLHAQVQVAVGDRSFDFVCPFGGPGRGYGRGAAWGGGRGPGPGRGYGAGAGRGFGPGAGLGIRVGVSVDADNDGVCDYYEQRHGLHQ
jgi:hypothetical protein